ncbi:MAG: phosphoheptose isomerase [Candidatus Muiribacterium halophilum]|uniref:Phosphoheptose isomerase n=1 Tax=Muiribacterium halophilum TaxID=2053465 RepID=A0A2N5ZK52_MUIH1|nr:MAG: phosphoheptose isomerase [Candidatus Muirbacterium halophilum]
MLFSEKIISLFEKKDSIMKLEDDVQSIINDIVKAYKENKKVIVFGNGGSASDALHMCAELQGRFFLDRKGLGAICLNTNVSTMTAVGNDLGFNEIFKKPLEGLLNQGDIVIGISTSGNSENVMRAIEYANDNGGKCFTLTGKDGGKLKDISDCLIAPSDITPEIQEIHIMIIHYICMRVEEILFG